MLNIRHEGMGPHFDKFHLDGLPFAGVLHRFTHPDEGDPHDHPWPFVSHILHGGYVEQIFSPDGQWTLADRKPGQVVRIGADHIHRIIYLPKGECWTLILPQGPAVQKSGFYQFREDGPYHRFWDEPDFSPITPG